MPWRAELPALSLGYFLHLAGVFLAYFLAGRLGLAAPFTSGNVSPVWPPAGVALAALLLFGPRVWPGIMAGAFLVNFLTPIPAGAALGMSLGNTLGPLLAAAALRRFGFDAQLGRLRDALALLGAALLGPAISATVGVSALYATGVQAWSGAGEAWLVWWLGDGMGVVLLTPLLLSAPRWWREERAQAAGVAAVVLLVAACSFVLFDDRYGLGLGEDLLAFAIFPLVIVAAIRFGTLGASATACTIAVITVWETALGSGPFVRYSSHLYNAAILQVFLAVLALTGMVVSTVIAERRAAQNELQRHSQQALATVSERLRLAQLAANIGAWEWEVATGRLTWSPELQAIHGFAPGEFDGRFETWVSTVHPEDRERVQREVGAAMAAGGPYDVEYRSIRPDGSEYWTAARGRVECDAGGAPVRMLGICMDITERKQAEEALRNSEKIAATGRLAATMAHEINNPLAAVANLLYLARTDDALRPETRRYLELMDQELRRVAHITKRTLGFYRDSSAPELLDLCQAADDVLSLFHKRLEERGIELVRRYRGRSAVWCNAGEVRQVISNLIANAADATAPGGKLYIRVAEARASGAGRRRGASICIADTGCGIAREHRSRLFQPFFTTKRDVGTGLGLWISAGIVRKHGGAIRLRSRVGRGTAFRIFLPAGEQAVAGTAA